MTSPDRPNRLKSNLVALSTAAVLAVYAAGYARTRAAAQRFSRADAERRPVASTSRHPSPDTTLRTVADAGAPTTRPAATPKSIDSSRTAGSSSAASHAPAFRPTVDTAASPATPAAIVADSITTSAPPAVTATTGDQAAVPPSGVPTVPAAAQGIDSAQHAADTALARYQDGIYTGWGTSRHGDIQASVEIRNGRIVGATIAQCLTRYSCSWISQLPAQVVARQSANVDYVSGATQSSNAFYYAVVDALAKAK